MANKNKKKVWASKCPQAGKGKVVEIPQTPRMGRRGTENKRPRPQKTRTR